MTYFWLFLSYHLRTRQTKHGGKSWVKVSKMSYGSTPVVRSFVGRKPCSIVGDLLQSTTCHFSSLLALVLFRHHLLKLNPTVKIYNVVSKKLDLCNRFNSP